MAESETPRRTCLVCTPPDLSLPTWEVLSPREDSEVVLLARGETVAILDGSKGLRASFEPERLWRYMIRRFWHVLGEDYYPSYVRKYGSGAVRAPGPLAVAIIDRLMEITARGIRDLSQHIRSFREELESLEAWAREAERRWGTSDPDRLKGIYREEECEARPNGRCRELERAITTANKLRWLRREYNSLLELRDRLDIVYGALAVAKYALSTDTSNTELRRMLAALAGCLPENEAKTLIDYLRPKNGGDEK